MKINLSTTHFKQIFKKLSLFSLLFLFTLQACKKDDLSNSLSADMAKSSVKIAVESTQFADNQWKKQLEKVLSAGNDSLKRSNIKMTGYEYQGTIKSINEIAALKASILSDENYIPTNSDGILNKFSATTFRDLKHALQANGEQNKAQLGIDLIQKHLDKEIKAGLDIIKIKWEENGKSFASTCLASKENGIVYDNMLSNMLLVKISTTKDFKGIVSSKAATRAAISEFEEWTPISWSARDEIAAFWLWGTERGSAWVERHVSGAKSSTNVKSISDYHSQTYDSMTLGQSASSCVIQEGEISSGPMGSLKFIWGMYLATPTGSISMTLKNGAYSFTMSNIISECHNSGVNFITPNSLN